MPFTLSHGVKIHYEAEGDGPPLVLHHGGWGCIEDWYEYGYVDRLKDHFRLILIDARAYGKSDKPHDPEQYSPEIHADDIVSILDDMNVTKCHFMGFSFGGRVGYWMGRFHPQRLLSLIILGSDPYLWDMDQMNGWIATTQTLDEWVPTDPVLSDKHKARWLENDKQALIASISRPFPDVSHVLQSLDLHFLVLCGDQDDSFEDAKRSAKEARNATFVQLDGFNHPDTLFRSDVIVLHVIKFLSSFKND